MKIAEAIRTRNASPTSDKVMAWLKKQKDDEVFPTKELSEKIGISYRMVQHCSRGIEKQGMSLMLGRVRFFGSVKAIRNLIAESEAA